MYEKLVAELREYWNDGTEDLRNQAADAIEELQAALDAVNDAHNEGFDVGYWAGRRDYEPKWIPVTERLPPDRTDVLAMTADCDIYVCDFIPSVKQFWTIPGDNLHIDDISHWMPLPPPPQEGEQE